MLVLCVKTDSILEKWHPNREIPPELPPQLYKNYDNEVIAFTGIIFLEQWRPLEELSIGEF